VTWEEAVRWLFALERRGVKLDLTRMRAALEELGSPERSFRSVLVAGTNGKGSTAAALASSLRLTGLRVGLYTSPHILDYRERIRLNGRLAPPEALLRRVETDRDIWERHELSFFEATTVMAFSYFRESAVDLAVLEVGLGGRLDATNTVEPILSIITPLGMDHAHLLGSTPAAIAREKAGILRPNVPAVLAGGSREAIEAVRSRAGEVGAPFYLRRECVRVDRIAPAPRGTRFRLRRRPGAPAGFVLPERGLSIETSLPGRHQVVNAAHAALALSLLRERGVAVDDEQIARGIRRLRWPGRLERPAKDRPLLADVAHNREGAQVVAQYLQGPARSREIRPVIAMLEKKDHQGYFRELRRVARRVWIAPLAVERAAPVEELKSAAEEAGLAVRLAPSVKEALEDALRGAFEPDGPLVLLAGSFHTVEAGYHALGVPAEEALWDE
jgi:dihydrofolate synthase/folylpolyglutamate synthase